MFLHYRFSGITLIENYLYYELFRRVFLQIMKNIEQLILYANDQSFIITGTALCDMMVYYYLSLTVLLKQLFIINYLEQLNLTRLFTIN